MSLRFQSRLMVFAAVPALIFVAALATALWGLMRTQDDFDRYTGRDQALAGALTEMYAQGLQSGQALRNIVLDPANKKAFANFEAADKRFDEAMQEALALSEGPVLARVQAIQPLRANQSARQAEVLALVKNDTAAATRALVEMETPAWRELRAKLMDEMKQGRESAAAAHAEARARASRATWATLALGLIAALVAAGLTALMQRTVARELGGDPADARVALQRIADGDLSGSDLGVGPRSGLMGELQRTRAQLQALVGQVRASSDGIHVASTEIATGNQDLSGRTEQTAASLQQTAASMSQLSDHVRQSADAARQANQLAGSAADVARRGGQVVDQVVATMGEIHSSSQRIADIIGVIDGIAFQTNILALNAAVEAARAGEQGRGFAVVAGEVRSLAQRAAGAAREIKTLIGTSVDRVEAGSQLVGEAGRTMHEIVGSVQRVTDIIGEITAAASEQTDGIGQVHTAVGQLDTMTQQNAALVEQSAAAAGSLRDQAGRLADLVASFRLATTA